MSLGLTKLESWLRTLRTVKHLRAGQVAWRLRCLAAGGLPRALASRSDIPSDQAILHQVCERIPRLPEFSRGCFGSSDLVGELQHNTLTLVGETLPFDFGAIDWRLGPQQKHRLWAITLHYHAWLYELAKLVGTDRDLDCKADLLFRSCLQDWLATCGLGQPGVESLAWNSYAIATRLGWWARIWHSLGKEYWQRNSKLAGQLLQSMYAQAVHLAANLEWDLRANHLLRDAVGLAWAGRFFEGSKAGRWLQTATRLAREQAREQVLSDGGHFERSPHYHLEAMRDFLSLAMLIQDPIVVDELRTAWVSMAEYAAWLRHPDGHSPQFNDSARVPPDQTLRLGEHLGLAVDSAARRGGRHFYETGLLAWLGSRWTVFFDVGELGPDYQAGHAQADTLTLECSFEGQRLFVDPGCYAYDFDERRAYDRATAAHNTVCIDGTDSSEVWHIFRVGRRARPVDVQVDIQPDQLSASAAHDGYRHLPGKPRHHREVRVAEHGPLQIRDRISGVGEHRVQAGWLLAPHWNATPDARRLGVDARPAFGASDC